LANEFVLIPEEILRPKEPVSSEERKTESQNLIVEDPQFDKYRRKLLEQLINKEDIQLNPRWIDIILSLSRCAGNLLLNIRLGN